MALRRGEAGDERARIDGEAEIAEERPRSRLQCPLADEQAAEAGIDCFVAGSAVYGKDGPGAAVAALRAQAAAAR